MITNDGTHIDCEGCCTAPGVLSAAFETTAQSRFDAAYVSSVEIAERLSVSRPAVLQARARGLLPDPIRVNDGQIYIWERKTLEPYLRAWEISIKLRRGQPVVIPQTTVQEAQ